MLGEQLGEASGTVTGVRVLGAGGEDHKLEVSFRGRGEMLGVGITDMGIFVQTIRPGGVLIGEGSNVLMLTDDGETVSWKGFGVGRPTGPGFSSSWGVAGSAHTASRKMARLNAVATVVEFEVEEDGSYRWKLWEWTGAASQG
ncbi:MAG: hypothetical protein M3R38_35845 [Actinomycetota bacterium]|nr:hypothetical protein [Actinomycetota bacterium]